MITIYHSSLEFFSMLAPPFDIELLQQIHYLISFLLVAADAYLILRDQVLESLIQVLPISDHFILSLSVLSQIHIMAVWCLNLKHNIN